MKRTFGFTLAAVFSLFLFSGCEVGLGERVSYLPPEVSIAYPPNGAVIREAFVMKGRASDDGNVSSVACTFLNIDTQQTYSYSASHSGSRWTARIPGKELADGKYKVTVKAVDDTGSANFAEVLYEIDNTAPLFVVNRPSTIQNGTSAADKYGAVFKILAQAADSHNIDKIRITLNGKTFVQKNPGYNIDVSFAYDENNAAALYNKALLDAQSSAGGILAAGIIIEDSARVYDGETKPEETEGNKTAETGYFLRTEVYKELEKTSLQRIADAYAGIFAQGGEAFETARQALDEMQKHKHSENFTFTLDPRLSPVVKSTNIAPVTADELTSISSVYTQDSLYIKLEPNNDETPLTDSAKKGAIQVKLLEPKAGGNVNNLLDAAQCNEVLLYDFANPESYPTASAEWQGNSCLLRAPLPSGVKIAPHRVIIDGADQNGNRFEIVNDKREFGKGGKAFFFIFDVRTNDSAPRVTVSRLANPYGKSAPTLTYNVSSASELTMLRWKEKTTDAGIEMSTANPIAKSGSYTLPEDKFKAMAEGEHFLTVTATNSSGHDTAEFRFVKDTVPPAVDMDRTLLDQQFTGAAKIGGQFIDETSGVKTSSFTIGKNKEAINSTMVKTTSFSWTINFPDISTYGSATYGDETSSGSGIYKVPLRIKAEDYAGNQTEVEVSLTIDPAGDKASVQFITPKNNSVLGGNVQITGSAKIKNLNAGVTVSAVELQISGNTPTESQYKNGAFIDADSFFSQDWTTPKNAKKWSGSGIAERAEGTLGWIKTIASDDFIKNGDANATVYMRARAKNSRGVYGAWTEPITVKLDSKVPKIEGLKIGGKDYVYNNWIAGDDNAVSFSIYDEAGIREVRLSGNVIEEKTWTATTPGQITASDFSTYFDVDTTHAVESGIQYKNYKLKDGALKIKSKEKGLKEARLTVAVTDGSEQKYVTTQEIVLRCDNDAPQGDFGKVLWSGRANFYNKEVTDPNDRARYPLTTNANSAKNGGKKLKLFVQGKAYGIASVDMANHKLTLDGSDQPAGGSGIPCVLYEQDIYIFNDPDTYGIQGFCYDDGSGVSPSNISAQIGSATMNSSDLNIAFLEGDYFKWTGKIDTSNEDGEKKLKLGFKDDLGNEYKPEVDVQVKNKQFKVKKITYETDVDQSGSISDDSAIGLVEKVESTAFKTPTSDRTHSCISELTDQGFIFTSENHSSIKMDLENGEASKCDVKCGSETIKTADPLTDGKITFSKSELEKIKAASEDKLTIRVFQSGKTVSPNDWYTEVKVPVKVEIEDKKTPAAAALPFYWNGMSDNSVEGNKGDNGHIEIKSDKSQVSGKVIVRGTAWDDRLLQTLTVSCASQTFTATYNKSNKNWTVSPSAETSGMKLEAATKSLNTTGHYADWTLTWDTSKTASGDKTITISAKDNASKSSSTTASSEPTEETVTRTNNQALTRTQAMSLGQLVCFVDSAQTDKDIGYFARLTQKGGSGSEWSFKRTTEPTGSGTTSGVPETFIKCKVYNPEYNKPSVTVQVVPYITGIEVTGATAIEGLKQRTLLGHYPARTDKTLTVKGFNLTGATFTINNASFTNNSMPTKSGAVVATSSGVQSINNTNNNAKEYNKGKNSRINGLLSENDDVFADVWEFSKENDAIKPDDGKLSGVVMRISPSNGMLGFSFNNGTSRFNMPEKDSKSQRMIERNWDTYGNGTFIFTSDGTPIGVASGRDLNTENSPKAAGFFTYYNKDATVGDNAGANYSGGTGRIRLECIGVRPNTSLDRAPILADQDRFLSPCFVAPTASKIYLAYFDNITKQIRFRNTNQLSHENASYPSGVPNDSNDGSNWSRFAGSGVKFDNSAHMSVDSTKPKTSSGSREAAGRHLCLGIKPNDSSSSPTIHIVWYDEEQSKLRYAKTSNPDANPPTWTDIQEIDNGGKYCSMVIDSAGDAHIAYQTADSHLGYALLKNGVITKEVIDSYNINGTGVTISLDASGKPVIGYYANWQQKARIAYKVNDKWDVAVVPSAYAVDDGRINACGWHGITNKGSSTSITKTGEKWFANKDGMTPVGYAVTNGFQSQIEIAQMR
ncbi:MAG: Ig-like domain-containing protein [Treponema sp.]